jgi:F-type H+-transporting ATPase subunit gamma
MIEPIYVFEPNPRAILEELLPYYVENTLYQSLLEAKASEHSARMVAMKNASENAGELMDELQLMFNKTRQESITNELLDITTASLTLN